MSRTAHAYMPTQVARGTHHVHLTDKWRDMVPQEIEVVRDGISVTKQVCSCEHC